MDRPMGRRVGWWPKALFSFGGLCAPLVCVALLGIAMLPPLPLNAQAAPPSAELPPPPSGSDESPAVSAGQGPDGAQTAPRDSTLDEDMDRIVEKSLQVAEIAVGGRTVMLGLALQNVKLNLFRTKPFANGRPPSAKMTNNLVVAPSVRIATGESYLLEIPMRTGIFRLGWDVEFNYSTFRTEKQEVRDVTVGKSLGTFVEGTFLGGGPLIFIKLGPLYPDTKIFWKAGGGVGFGIIEFEGKVLFRNNLSSETSKEKVAYRELQPNLYLYGVWMMEWENWRLIYTENNVRGSADFGQFFYRETSIIFGYSLTF